MLTTKETLIFLQTMQIVLFDEDFTSIGVNLN